MGHVSGASAIVVAVLTAAALVQFTLTRSGSLDRNALIGIRTSATLSSDAAWKAGHQAAQPALLTTAVTGVVTLVAVLGLWFLVPTAATALAVVSATGLVVVAGLFVRVALSANKAARAAGGGESPPRAGQG